MRLISAVVALVFVVAGCSASTGAGTTVATDPGPNDAVGTEEPVSEEPFLPDPDARLPTATKALAGEVRKVDRALKESIAEWKANGDLSRSKAPRAVVLQSIYQQRLYREIGTSIRRAKKVARHLPRPLARSVIRNARARLSLAHLGRPVPGKKARSLFATQQPEPAGKLLRYYKRAQRRFGVWWQVLAAINMVETRFGRIKSESYAGARGPMQFMPATWEGYGMGGDIDDPRDAIMAAANYLRASGAPDDYQSALYAYNHSQAYVDAILLYAKEMIVDPHRYFAYYNHQVFVRTTKGDVRLTGPGT